MENGRGSSILRQSEHRVRVFDAQVLRVVSDLLGRLAIGLLHPHLEFRLLSQQRLQRGAALVRFSLFLGKLRLHVCQPRTSILGRVGSRTQWYFLVEMKSRARQHWRRK